MDHTEQDDSTRCVHQDAVKWNPYNHVVQCHRCGHLFVPATGEQYDEVRHQLEVDGYLPNYDLDNIGR